ncbi:glutathione transferase GstA [Acinetobacter baumannii]|uniref:glutathione transferase GstA n=1 Tax=Acinetobacter baumannii TaxID=470 RepID=UPI0023415EE5|nr:glutathione transferase GstA [Acinetobacter baumannii]MDC4414432.1 glutathione transferase GstA [Acinetobacter baumannii]MDH2520309.1 glutathione transferase GstA [Acinetobacter baumannii]MDK2200816.1 glutathione transferase GstA [Acinetobacter baumannii]
MKLYFAPNACSLSPHIILHELGFSFELVRVNNQTKKTSEGGNFFDINPKGYVAALILDDGQVLTEGPAILQYLADLKPEANLAPKNGSWERIRLQELLNFITTEIHSGSAPLFNSEIPDSVKEIFKQKLYKRFDFLVNILQKNNYLTGSNFSVADAYLYTVLTWMEHFSIHVEDWPVLYKYMKLIESRDSVKKALVAEAATSAVV